MNTVDRGSVVTDQRIRHLLRAGRRAAGNLSQREAAERAGISEVYWQKIESGTQPSAPPGTLVAMLTAVGTTMAQLQDEGYADLALAAADYNALHAPSVPPTPEDHLAATPGATAEEIGALQAVWRALRASRTAEPYSQEFERSRRPRDQDS